MPYIVIRLVPTQPVDGPTFATYLDGLQLQLFAADAPGGEIIPLSDYVLCSPLVVYQFAEFGNSSPYFTSVSAPLSEPTAFVASNNYGNTLHFGSTDGIAVGSYLFSADPNNPFYGITPQVTQVDGNLVTLDSSKPLPKYAPSGTIASFINQSLNSNPWAGGPAGASFNLSTTSAATTLDGLKTGSLSDPLLVLTFAPSDIGGISIGMTVASSGGEIPTGTTVAFVDSTNSTITVDTAMSGSPAAVTFTSNQPSFSFQLTPQSVSATQLIFGTNGAQGVACGMTLNPVSGFIAAGTKVTAVTMDRVTVSPNLIGSPSSLPAVTFSFPLSSGIVQHLEEIWWEESSIFSSTSGYLIAPMAVATAVIPLNSLTPPPPEYVNISVIATRNKVNIPVDEIFYNVLVIGDQVPASPQLYQFIPSDNTALYISLPPPPGLGAPIALTMPTDGSAPPFDELYTALTSALQADPIIGPKLGTAPSPQLLLTTIVGLTSEDWTRLAYEIVWSYQEKLPTPPDPLETLYTNPYFVPDFSKNPPIGASNANNDTDRNKFEGTLNSFYSTRNADGTRLTKFVAAIAAAVYCEQLSAQATTALLEFPVNPAAPFNTAVESEVLLQGLGASGVSGVNFGVPAGFFYALGAKLDQSTTGDQRYQLATGDKVERLLQEFGTAVATGVIEGIESFTVTNPGTSISSFQAARRLVALGISAASTSPAVLVPSGGALARLVTDWLNATAPFTLPPPNPQPTYQSLDFQVWTQLLATKDPLGYLKLDLAALTRGYVIPSFSAKTSVNSSSASQLTFAGTGGIGVGMSVYGPNIAPGTTVTGVTTTVTIQPAVQGDVPAGSLISFNGASPAVAALTSVDCPSGTQLAFAEALGVLATMTVSGQNIALGTTVASATTSVTLSAGASTAVTAGAVITFNLLNAPVTAMTNADTPSGDKLTFPVTSGISNDMVVTGPNIVSGDTVTNVTLTTTLTTVTLKTPVSDDVPIGSAITFTTPVPPNALASTLADQIALWLTTPATPNPTVASLLQVTAGQWTAFFTEYPTWLPSFTQPVAPAASATGSTPASQKPGYRTALIKAFIRAVQKFFTVSSVPSSPDLLPPGSPPSFSPPQYDLIGQALGNYQSGGFQFGSGALSSTDLASAVSLTVPNDAAAQAWLQEAISTINALCQIASVVTLPSGDTKVLPIPPSISFSVVEALYARGFRSSNDILSLATNDFQQALTGTVAYDDATLLYNQAKTLASTTAPTPLPPTNGTFQPINPNGTLVNCVPPPCLSPFGPIAYLQEMLNLSQGSTCDNPWPAERVRLRDAQLPESTTLGNALQTRRGSLGALLASCANLETPLPLIDIVNECLQYLGASQTPTGGTIYDTSADALAGHRLCKEHNGRKHDDGCHDPALIFAAIPEYSTPAAPVAATACYPGNQSVEPLVFNNLKIDFSACCLPYSQALDVSRTYLRHFRSNRFEEMRTFRKCITDFALAPIASQPADFRSHLMRFPVRINTGIEYLGISPEEYCQLFQGSMPTSCGPPPRQDLSVHEAAKVVSLGRRAAIASANQSVDEREETVAEFLSRTCLTYCEFVELQQSGFGSFGNSSREGDKEEVQPFPDCEPCCLQSYSIRFVTPQDPETALHQLCVFIRLWRKLREHCGAGYSFAQLADICQVLQLFQGSSSPSPGSINPEFIRQLVAFQMLRDYFNLPLVDPADHTTATTGADRTHLLAIWVGNSATKWHWALGRLLEGVESCARLRHGGVRQHDEVVRRLADNLDALSVLAGFNPKMADMWNSSPTCTLRFAEVLAKIAASNFQAEEVLYLFNAAHPQDCDDPFPLQEPDVALNHPLDLPDDDEHHSLWKLRDALLAVRVPEEEACAWTWMRIVAELREQFGYVPPSGSDPLLSIGQHFFPDVLEASGFAVSGQQRQYREALAATTAPWNAPPGSPFQYDTSAKELWIQLPLVDEAVIAKLSQIPTLSGPEQVVVQDLYFAPRADLALFAFMFPDWHSAEKHLIQEKSEAERWSYFRRHFALANARRKAIVEHLAKHVAHRAGCAHEELDGVAGLVLRQLFADENKNNGAPGESDCGTTPPVTWTPPPCGGAISALLGLTGTGLLGEYGPALAAGQNAALPAVVWREVRGPLTAFGHERDQANSPVPTVLPAFGLMLSATNPAIALDNGFAVRKSDGRRLGGGAGFHVCWSGVLLVDREGEYAFHAGAPTPEGEKPDFERAEKSQWRVTLKRGQKSWVVLNHQWPGNSDHERAAPRLRRGAHQIVIEFNRPTPDFSAGCEDHPQHTGFQVKYAGPDSEGCLIALPLQHLYRDFKDGTLAQGITPLPGSKSATAFLGTMYTSTLRDIRRTYQRAFKAVLFAGRFGLSAQPVAEDCQSELGYMLANPANFAGNSCYRNSSNVFTLHRANFDFNFLPLDDNYHPPTPVPPDRSQPSPQRIQAMFDWWERVFDYEIANRDVRRRCQSYLWLLFNEAKVKQPTDPTSLLRHLCSHDGNLDLRYFQDEFNPVYSVSNVDLEDDRWVVRVWHAARWLRALTQRFHVKELSKARPDLWASDDPSALVMGETVTGNANLQAFLVDGCIETGEPRRYQDIKQLNDGLRQRGRDALVQYLCAMNRVPLPGQTGVYATQPGDLSALLLLDVQAGLCEKASRIEEAITAVQTFIRRSRLGLEPTWKVNHGFARLWDSRFETYRIWERCKRREIYRENWIEWAELGKARRSEAFRFLESELRRSTLTLAAPGGLEWWPDEDEPLEHGLKLLQRREPSELHRLSAPPAPSTTREGLDLLGKPERAGRSTWLAAVPPPVPADPAASLLSPTPTPPSSPPPSVPKIAHQVVQAAATGSAQPLPLWMESAIKLGKRFCRIAAAGLPQAGREFAHGTEIQRSCCCACGHEHPLLVDEYYFWLIDTQHFDAPNNSQDTSPDGSSDGFQSTYQFGYQDSYYDQFQQQSTEWNDEDQVPQLLADWQPTPAVRLAWCRFHNCEFGQIRTSEECVEVSTASPDLVFLGRAGDSLYFSVSASAAAPPGYEGPAAPGFRYDLPSDRAVALPLVYPPPTSPPSPPTTSLYPGGLPAYPYFAYQEPGARLFPGAWFSPALAVADVLRAHCRFELALRWYRRVFDPLDRDCTWMNCDSDSSWGKAGPPSNLDATGAPGKASSPPTTTKLAPRDVDRSMTNLGACCDCATTTEEVARNRSLTLHYCQTLLEWGEALMRRRPSPEAFQQARLIYDTVAQIMGKRPNNVSLAEPPNPQCVADFTPAYAPLNPRLLDLYDRVTERLGWIHDCVDARRLHNGRPNRDMPYFGDNPLREGWRSTVQICADDADWCHRPSPYRFVFLIQKAQELAGRVRELGAALLAAYEKGDGEYLASLRAGNERELLALGLTNRQDQWRDADWQIQALQQTKDVNQANLIYYNNLYQNGLINDEIQNQNLATNAIQTHTSTIAVNVVGEVMSIIPDVFVGAVSSFTQVPIGTKLKGLFDTISQVMTTMAEIQSATAAIDMTLAGWERRSDEWCHQMQTLPIEIQQIELQILGAQRRRNVALQELNNQQRQIEQSSEIQDFLRDKFTATERYLWLQKETAALYSKTYELALHSARQAERAFNFERGHTTKHFLPEEAWDNLHEGLMAGERLEFALKLMEKAYCDENVREYELTKHFSLRLQFPQAYLQLRTTGHCEIDLPEWMFDLDFPGQYMRRIKNFSVTIPCVTGPYTGVHFRLTLLSSVTRIDPRLEPPAHACCDRCERHNGYEFCADDPRIVRQYGALEAVATSSGQNDSGLFELNFRDDRYLPFEFHGAVCRLRLELPPENNYFDMDTLSDVIVNLNYTSREGGGMLRKAAMEAARQHLPGAGWCFFDVRHEFPDGWQVLRNSSREKGRDARLGLRLERRMFPFLPDSDEVSIARIAVLFHASGHECDCPKTGACRCQRDREPDCRVLEFTSGDHHRRDQPTRVSCVRSEEWPDLYYGLIETEIGPIGKRGARPEIEFRFPHDVGEVETVYLLCQYKR